MEKHHTARLEMSSILTDFKIVTLALNTENSEEWRSLRCNLWHVYVRPTHLDVSERDRFVKYPDSTADIRFER